ncbi:hypothetical protein F3K02_09205 [Hydrogenophaga sp. D2P1]|uniref:YqaJ viral recombinase domain-containing protein n=1 Tax=Hydrogenophaga aromaticivorans TaxID=2610898 RepID=A0A7Y8GWR5_9BURK|nr:YqaJ viral recombinase family protein [Hydrogenophaga aromaticivorans]NWF45423.1 hypothetical protein [Hydrogenophaga aromaticivorans]
MNMTFHDFAQGSPEWHQHRSTHFNASDAPAMMGCSPYQTRTELLTRMKTGISAEVDAGTQRRFDDGHRFEALARPLAEKIISDDLYPVTGSRGDLSASFDGLTLDGMTAFEHKTLNTELIVWFGQYDRSDVESIINSAGNHLPLTYRVQMEQQMAVSGADRVLFMASNWQGETLVEERHCWYASDSYLRAKIVAGWAQFAKDLIDFTPAAAEPIKPVGRTPDQLPALRSSVKGELVLESNIKEWESAALVYIQTVRDHELKTDQDFEDADAAVKWCVSSKTTLDGLKSNLMSATGDVNTAVGTLDRLMSELDKTRIQFTKAMDARKAERKAEIVAGGIAAYEKHESELIRDTGGPWIVLGKPDFGGAIKNLRTFTSIQNAVDTALAAAKMKADESARKIRESLRILADDGAGYEFLFNDRLALIGKAADDLRLLVKSRIAEHQAAEKAKEEAQRERIRAEEAARLEREAAAKAAAEKADADRLERERAHAAQVEADRISREQAEAVSAARIREEQAKPMQRITAFAEVEDVQVTFVHPEPDLYAELSAVGTPVAGVKLIHGEVGHIDPAVRFVKSEDNGTRLTLGQLNDRLAPVSINVAGLSTLGFDPVEQVKASRFYRECDLPAICGAISAHVLAACATEAA